MLNEAVIPLIPMLKNDDISFCIWSNAEWGSHSLDSTVEEWWHQKGNCAASLEHRWSHPPLTTWETEGCCTGCPSWPFSIHGSQKRTACIHWLWCVSQEWMTAKMDAMTKILWQRQERQWQCSQPWSHQWWEVFDHEDSQPLLQRWNDMWMNNCCEDDKQRTVVKIANFFEKTMSYQKTMKLCDCNDLHCQHGCDELHWQWTVVNVTQQQQQHQRLHQHWVGWPPATLLVVVWTDQSFFGGLYFLPPTVLFIRFSSFPPCTVILYFLFLFRHSFFLIFKYLLLYLELFFSLVLSFLFFFVL